MRTLPIIWQRLVDSEGQTCDRCGGTLESIREAVSKLEIILRPVNIKPVLETRELNHDTFKMDPSQSNRIWISGKPLEEWLGADVASSPCCTVCEGFECRTIEFGQKIYETIPSELIIKAALIAASKLSAPGK